MTDQASRFTAKELEYTAAALQSLQDEIPTHSMLDKAKFNALTGLTEASARTIWNKLRKKLADGKGGGEAPAVAVICGGKKSLSRKRNMGRLDEVELDTLHPNKKRRTAKPKELEQDDGEELGAEAEVEEAA